MRLINYVKKIGNIRKTHWYFGILKSKGLALIERGESLKIDEDEILSVTFVKDNGWPIEEWNMGILF